MTVECSGLLAALFSPIYGITLDGPGKEDNFNNSFLRSERESTMFTPRITS
jgi:hypothetical protein